MAEWVPIQKKK